MREVFEIVAHFKVKTFDSAEFVLQCRCTYLSSLYCSQLCNPELLVPRGTEPIAQVHIFLDGKRGQKQVINLVIHPPVTDSLKKSAPTEDGGHLQEPEARVVLTLIPRSLASYTYTELLSGFKHIFIFIPSKHLSSYMVPCTQCLEYCQKVHLT